MNRQDLDYYHSIIKRLVDNFGYSSIISYNQLFTILHDLNNYLPSNVHFHIPQMIEVMCRIQFLEKVPPKSLYHFLKQNNIHQYKLPDSAEEIESYYTNELF